MSLQCDAIRNVFILTNGLWRTVDSLLQILHHELGVLPLLAEVDTHEAMAASNVNKGTSVGIYIRKIVVVDEMANLVAFSTCQARHSSSHAFRSCGIFAKGSKHGLLVDCVMCKVEASLGQRCSLGIGMQSLQSVSSGWEDVLGVEANPVPETVIFGEHSRCSSMSDIAGLWLLKHIVRHGMAQTAG